MQRKAAALIDRRQVVVSAVYLLHIKRLTGALRTSTRLGTFNSWKEEPYEPSHQ
ncbi:hypothetical protein [Oryzifoliimicrobium ureilyticus]|uniref:hypothetical protein n=1 Tax=Oryzifoliimicrobium ureilyticus TaxID=3113724 RepID=UPI0030762CF0